jgi:hypothetical protein
LPRGFLCVLGESLGFVSRNHSGCGNCGRIEERFRRSRRGGGHRPAARRGTSDLSREWRHLLYQ